MALSFDEYIRVQEGPGFVENLGYPQPAFAPNFPIGNYDIGDCEKCGEEVFVDQIILKKREYMTFSYDVDLPPMHVPKPYKPACSQGRGPAYPAPRFGVPVAPVPYGAVPHGVEGAVAFKRF